MHATSTRAGKKNAGKVPSPQKEKNGPRAGKEVKKAERRVVKEN